jgi:hypothetical protein
MFRRLFGRKPAPEQAQTSSLESLPAPPPQAPGAAPTLPWGSMVQVVGESHYEQSFLAICGPPTFDGYRMDCLAELRPQPNNPYDPAAVAVFINGLQVGHLSREDARRYGPVVHEALRTHGQATCYAAILGGWDRGGGGRGGYGVRLRFSDRTWQFAPVEADEVRLPTGGAVSVSNEQEYQDALIDALRGADLSIGSFPSLAELVPADRNPHLKKDSGRVLEVRIGGRTIGFLTKAMSDRYHRSVEAAVSAGKRTTCEASLFAGTKGGESIIEVRLHASPPSSD